MDQESLVEFLLLLAENTAKIIYNETNPRDSFDEDSGWWVAENLWVIEIKGQTTITSLFNEQNGKNNRTKNYSRPQEAARLISCVEPERLLRTKTNNEN
ncbi:MAG: hypothetical protein V2I50_11740 [Desulfuromusa sp.]|nr:hypothetical protein [Desulfuromusa sp.]